MPQSRALVGLRLAQVLVQVRGRELPSYGRTHVPIQANSAIVANVLAGLARGASPKRAFRQRIAVRPTGIAPRPKPMKPPAAAAASPSRPISRWTTPNATTTTAATRAADGSSHRARPVRSGRFSEHGSRHDHADPPSGPWASCRASEKGSSRQEVLDRAGTVLSSSQPGVYQIGEV